MSDPAASKEDDHRHLDPTAGVTIGSDVFVPDLAQLLDALDEGVYGIDRRGRCTFINRTALFLLGYDNAENVLGRNMHDLIHHTRPDGSAYPAQDCPMLRTITGGGPVLLDDELLWRRDGTSFLAEYASSPLVIRGAVVGSVIRFEDLSSKRQARQRLAVQQEVSQILGGEIEVPDAQERVLAAIGSGFGWIAGAMWLTEASGSDRITMQRVAIWSGPGAARKHAEVSFVAGPHVIRAAREASPKYSL